MSVERISIAALLLAAALPVSGLLFAADDPAAFEQKVTPLFSESCTVCHNAQLASGSLNLAPFTAPGSLVDKREEWEQIVHKLRTGEMPPRGIPRPPQERIDALVLFVQNQFEKADSKVKPDPGRVTARRLNRNEYSNTIRDLLAVDFRADKDFPTDDSGHGFDNIGDVLTISPVLMEKYMSAAERISATAIGANPLPDKPVESEYHRKDKTIRRIDPSTIEAVHRVEWDGEYIVRIGLPGERKDGAPVLLRFSMDGRELHSQMAETKPSGLVYFDPYSMEEMRLVLPAGDHVFRAGFVNDEFVKTVPQKELYDRENNKFI
jgi:mono/diheme cytochrome c family protein